MTILTKIATARIWKTHLLLIARLIVGGVFLMAAYFKFADMGSTATAIASIHFPFPLFFAWAAAIFELIIGLKIITGWMFREGAMLAALYILFLAFAFHGPSTWSSSMDQYGFFVDHFTFIAGLLFMIAHGPGETWRIKKGSA
jgi:uncharacterized membrane protein YphA (DoxX/SURF4 family)